MKAQQSLFSSAVPALLLGSSMLLVAGCSSNNNSSAKPTGEAQAAAAASTTGGVPASAAANPTVDAQAAAAVGTTVTPAEANTTGSTPAPGTSAPAAPGSVQQAPLHPFLQALAGNWLAPCHNSSSGGSGQQQLTVNDAVGKLTTRDYSDSDCNTPATPAVNEVTFSIVAPGGTTSTALGEATNVDVTPESMTVDGQPLPAEAAAQIPTATSYDIMLISDAKLYSGSQTEGHDGSSAEKRTEVLETDSRFVFVRQ